MCYITFTCQYWFNRIHEPIQASRSTLNRKMTIKSRSVFLCCVNQSQTFLPKGAPVLDMPISFKRSCVHHDSLISAWAIDLLISPKADKSPNPSSSKNKIPIYFMYTQTYSISSKVHGTHLAPKATRKYQHLTYQHLNVVCWIMMVLTVPE